MLELFFQDYPITPALATVLGTTLGLWCSFKLCLLLKFRAAHRPQPKQPPSISNNKRSSPKPTPSGLATFLTNELIQNENNSKLRNLGTLLNLEHCSEEIRRVAHIHLDEFIDNSLTQRLPIFWLNLPHFIKNRIYTNAHRNLPRLLDDLLEDLLAEIDTLWNLEIQIDRRFNEQPDLEHQLFHHVLASDVRRASTLAACFGFGAGVVQLLLNNYLYESLTLGVASGILALSAASLHLHYCLRDYKPTPEGYAAPEYRSVTERLYRFIGENFLAPRHVVDAILIDSDGIRTNQLMRKHSKAFTDSSLLKPVIQLGKGFTEYAEVKCHIINAMPQLISKSLQDPQFNHHQTQAIHQTLVDNAVKSPAEEQQRLVNILNQRIRPSYLTIAAVIGTVLGLFQALW